MLMIEIDQAFMGHLDGTEPKVKHYDEYRKYELVVNRLSGVALDATVSD